MSKLTANINIGDFDECKVSHDILCDILQNEDINVGIRLKYINEYNQKLKKENNMNVPFVKVNNQQEFERVVDKMQRETGFKLHESSKCGADSIYNVIGIDDDFDILLYDPSHDDNKHLKIISADEYLTRARENFTLGDLEDGMVVEYRNGEKRLFLNGSFLGIDSYAIITDFNEDLSHRLLKKSDIVKVYKVNSFNHSLIGLPAISNLTLIFDAETHRNKSKISQRKSEIENEMAKLQEKLKLLEVE